jgi:hypothetical protein
MRKASPGITLNFNMQRDDYFQLNMEFGETGRNERMRRQKKALMLFLQVMCYAVNSEKARYMYFWNALLPKI